MKLLFDQNLSPRLVLRLADVFSGSTHVREHGMAEANDERVWNFAAERGFMIVTKDSDFLQRSLVFGHPPKVIWIRRGNRSTAEIEALLRDRKDDIFRFDSDPDQSLLFVS